MHGRNLLGLAILNIAIPCWRRARARARARAWRLGHPTTTYTQDQTKACRDQERREGVSPGVVLRKHRLLKVVKGGKMTWTCVVGSVLFVGAIVVLKLWIDD